MNPKDSSTRRTFLQGASAAVIGSSVAGSALGTPTAKAVDQGHARGDDLLRVALVGCGGRGTGAANQALKTDGKVELVAMADAFENNLESSHATLVKRRGEKVQVPAENKYVGFDAYRRAIDSGADVIILAAPPGFRPEHFEYAVEQGKHVFMEKPLAVDGPGVRRVLEAARKAKQQNLRVGVGLQRHHDPSYVEAIDRIRNGAIGDISYLRVYWNSAGVWVRPREEGQTEMEYQMRNWYYFNWLCGDHIVEQHIHNLDVGNWVKGEYPVKAQGQGGRQSRNGKDHGEIYDHHMVEFTYADGSTMLSQCRHIADTWDQVAEFAHGTSGAAALHAGRMTADGGWDWRYRGEDVDPYQAEHDALFAAIREGREHDETENGAYSTLTSVLGRMATYSGRVVTWDEALASNVDLAPQKYAWDADPQSLPDAEGRYTIPMPGVTKAV